MTCSGAMNCVEVRDDAMIHSSEYVSSNTVIRRLRTMKYRARVYIKLYALCCRGSDLIASNQGSLALTDKSSVLITCDTAIGISTAHW